MGNLWSTRKGKSPTVSPTSEEAPKIQTAEPSFAESEKKTPIAPPVEEKAAEEPESNDTSYGVEATAVRTLAASTGTVAILGTTAKTPVSPADGPSPKSDEAKSDISSSEGPSTEAPTFEFVNYTEPTKNISLDSKDELELTEKNGEKLGDIIDEQKKLIERNEAMDMEREESTTDDDTRAEISIKDFETGSEKLKEDKAGDNSDITRNGHSEIKSPAESENDVPQFSKEDISESQNTDEGSTLGLSDTTPKIQLQTETPSSSEKSEEEKGAKEMKSEDENPETKSSPVTDNGQHIMVEEEDVTKSISSEQLQTNSVSDVSISETGMPEIENSEKPSDAPQVSLPDATNDLLAAERKAQEEEAVKPEEIIELKQEEKEVIELKQEEKEVVELKQEEKEIIESKQEEEIIELKQEEKEIKTEEDKSNEDSVVVEADNVSSTKEENKIEVNQEEPVKVEETIVSTTEPPSTPNALDSNPSQAEGLTSKTPITDDIKAESPTQAKEDEEDSDKLNNAAVTIQASFRGYKTRQNLKTQPELKDETVTPPELSNSTIERVRVDVDEICKQAVEKTESIISSRASSAKQSVDLPSPQLENGESPEDFPNPPEETSDKDMDNEDVPNFPPPAPEEGLSEEVTLDSELPPPDFDALESSITEDMNTEIALPTPEIKSDVKDSTDGDLTLDEDLEELSMLQKPAECDDLSMNEAEIEAATKIQAGVRGYLTRKKMNRAQTMSAIESRLNRGEAVDVSFDKSEPLSTENTEGITEEIEKLNDSINLLVDEKEPEVPEGESGTVPPTPTDQNMVKRKQVDNEEEAATIIQSTFRGYKTRQEMKKAKTEIDEKEGESGDEQFDEEGPSLEKNESVENESATKIQAGVRGYLVRKRQKAEKAAAVKIQAGYRGFKVRQQMKEK